MCSGMLGFRYRLVQRLNHVTRSLFFLFLHTVFPNISFIERLVSFMNTKRWHQEEGWHFSVLTDKRKNFGRSSHRKERILLSQNSSKKPSTLARRKHWLTKTSQSLPLDSRENLIADKPYAWEVWGPIKKEQGLEGTQGWQPTKVLSKT